MLDFVFGYCFGSWEASRARVARLRARAEGENVLAVAAGRAVSRWRVALWLMERRTAKREAAKSRAEAYRLLIERRRHDRSLRRREFARRLRRRLLRTLLWIFAAIGLVNTAAVVVVLMVLGRGH